MSGFSCHSSFSTHICNTCQFKLVPLARCQEPTFLKVLRPARMLPPVHVV